MKRYVTLTATNRRISLGSYVKGIKAAKSNPDTVFKHGLSTWWSVTGAEIMHQFRAGMHDRINEGIPAIERGREVS